MNNEDIRLNNNIGCDESCNNVVLLNVNRLSMLADMIEPVTHTEQDTAVITIEEERNNEVVDTNNKSCLKTFLKDWSSLIVNASSHLAATAILTSLTFWDKRGVVPRLLGAILGQTGIPILSLYIEKNQAQLSKTALKALKITLQGLTTVAIAGTVAETAIFNLGRLNPEELQEVENFFYMIFCEKIFWNEITMIFSSEQILALAQNVFSFITILGEYDNSFTKTATKIIEKMRTVLVVLGFSLVTNSVLTKTDHPESIENNKPLICLGIQLASLGATSGLIRSTYDCLKSIITKCKSFCKNDHSATDNQSREDSEEAYYDAKETFSADNDGCEETAL